MDEEYYVALAKVRLERSEELLSEAKTPEDYQRIARAEQIRNASDYDDFYVANKAESRQQVEDAEYLLNKIKQYIIGLKK